MPLIIARRIKSISMNFKGSVEPTTEKKKTENRMNTESGIVKNILKRLEQRREKGIDEKKRWRNRHLLIC